MLYYCIESGRHKKEQVTTNLISKTTLIAYSGCSVIKNNFSDFFTKERVAFKLNLLAYFLSVENIKHIMSSASLPDVPAQEDGDKSFQTKLKEFCNKNFFLMGLVFVVLLGIFVPEIAHKEGPLRPDITASWIAVIVIFLISGLGVKSTELRRATLFWQLNLFVHFFIFIFYPVIGLIITSILKPVTSLNDALLDGLLICLCLPTTISSAVVLTLNCYGNEAASVINTAMANMLGIVVTPGLILIFLGNLGSVSIGEIFFKLTIRVIVPFVFGQIVRNFDAIKDKCCNICKNKNKNKDSKQHNDKITMIQRITKHKKKLKKLSEILLLFIVWCAISESFYTGVDADITDVIVMLVIVIILHVFCLIVVWNLSGINEKLKNRVTRKNIQNSNKRVTGVNSGPNGNVPASASLKSGTANNSTPQPSLYDHYSESKNKDDSDDRELSCLSLACAFLAFFFVCLFVACPFWCNYSIHIYTWCFDLFIILLE